jgi:hypothetical protein
MGLIGHDDRRAIIIVELPGFVTFEEVPVRKLDVRSKYQRCAADLGPIAKVPAASDGVTADQVFSEFAPENFSGNLLSPRPSHRVGAWTNRLSKTWPERSDNRTRTDASADKRAPLTRRSFLRSPYSKYAYSYSPSCSEPSGRRPCALPSMPSFAR